MSEEHEAIFFFEGSDVALDSENTIDTTQSTSDSHEPHTEISQSPPEASLPRIEVDPPVTTVVAVLPSHHGILMTQALLDFYVRASVGQRASPEVAEQIYVQVAGQLTAHGVTPAKSKEFSSPETSILRHGCLAALSGLVENVMENPPATHGVANRHKNDVSGRSSAAGLLTESPNLSKDATKQKGHHSLGAELKKSKRKKAPLKTAQDMLAGTSPFSRTGLANPSRYAVDFQELGRLGKGGFGRVFRVRNRIDGNEYALKKIRARTSILMPKKTKPHPLDDIEGYDFEDAALKRVLSEAKVLARMEHVNIVRYFSSWIEQPLIQLDIVKRREDFSFDLHHNFSEVGVLPEKDQGDMKLGGLVSEDTYGDSEVICDYSTEDDTYEFGNGNILAVVSQGSSKKEKKKNGTVFMLHILMSLHPLTLTKYISLGSPAVISPIRAPQAADIKDERHCFCLRASLDIFMEILEGVQYLHSKGIIHRDLKPGNVFLDLVECSTPSSLETNASSPASSINDNLGGCAYCGNGGWNGRIQPKIGDFGLVVDLKGKQTGMAKSAGTTPYRPPVESDESHGVVEIGEKVDVFSLGIILYELINRFNSGAERVACLDTLRGNRELPDDFIKRMKDDEVMKDIGDIILGCVTWRDERIGIADLIEGVSKIMKTLSIVAAPDSN